MITEQQIIEAIAECQGERDPNANTCYKLAAYYIILNEMRGQTLSQPLSMTTYSQDPPDSTVHFDSDSEFAQAIQGMDSDRAWAIVDDLVATLWAVNKPLYNALMRQIKA